jgi:hypothetical protein
LTEIAEKDSWAFVATASFALGNPLTASLDWQKKFPTYHPILNDRDLTHWKVDCTMKILEAQSATLTNYEVYTHLMDQQARYKARHRMGTTA